MASPNINRRKYIKIFGITGLVLLMLLTGTAFFDSRANFSTYLQKALYISNRSKTTNTRISSIVRKSQSYNASLVMNIRLRHLIEKCQSRENFTQVSGRKPLFFYLAHEGFAVCKGPKTGSSFMGAIVMTLKSHNDSLNPFSLDREKIHGRNEVNYRNIASLRGIKLLVTRDPYMRLYSAYVDKVFVLFTTIGRHLSKVMKTGLYTKDGTACGYNVTFQQFLDFYTDQALQGGIVNEHMVPISDLCYPCTIQYDMIARQETLLVDTQHVFNQLNLTESQQTVVVNSLNPNNTINTIYSLLRSYRSHYNMFKADCPNGTLYMEKVWTSLQIQGYVSQQVPFPSWYFRNVSVLDVEDVMFIVSETRQNYPLTKEQITFQRNNYVTTAYSDIRPDTIEKIKKVYKRDFVLFGYDLTPPHKRQTGDF